MPSDDSTNTNNTSSIYGALIANAVYGGIIYIIFEIVKTQKAIFSPRKMSNTLKAPKANISSSPLSWAINSMAVEDIETLEIVGFDAFVFLRFVKLMCIVSAVCAFLGFAILLPIYGTGGFGLPGVGMLTMGNIPNGSTKLWAPWVLTYVFTGLTLYLLHSEYVYFAKLRQRYFSNPGDDVNVQVGYSCIVENIPPALQSQDSLTIFFNELFPNQIYSVCFTYTTAECEKLIAERDKWICLYEGAVAEFEAEDDPTKIPLVGLKNDTRKPVLCYGGDKVESIPYYKGEIERLSEKLAFLQSVAVEIKRGPLESGSSSEFLDAIMSSIQLSTTAFVTFTSIRAQLAAASMPVMSDVYPHLIVHTARSPSDIIWANITTSQDTIERGGMIVMILLYVGVLYWSVIVSFIGIISDLNNLVPYLPFIANINPGLFAIIAGILPVIILNFFLSLLPTIFGFLARTVTQMKSISEIADFVCSWCFIYSLANLYLILLAGSAVVVVTGAIGNPLSVVTLIGSAIPTVSTFFINLLLANWISGIPSSLLRLTPLVIINFYLRCVNDRKLTIRDFLSGPMSPASIDYSSEIPNLLFTVLIILLYWTIAPIVSAVGAFYLATLYCQYKYQLLYVYVPEFESGGMFFFQLHSYSMYGLMTSSVAALGYMGIRLGLFQTILFLPLPLIVYMSW